MSKSFRPRRSVLYVPAANEKALAKAPSLACDVVVIDLEDAVAPSAKEEARARLAGVFAGRGEGGPDLVIRVNALSSPWGVDDLAAAAACAPNAILLPKVDGPKDVLAADDLLDSLDADPAIRLWTMIETPKGMLNLGPIAELGRDRAARLACLVAGTNDLAKETGVRMTPDRRWLIAWLQQIVLAARAGGLDALDGVCNDFRDLDAFARECDDGRAMGFDGKTLIHPAQIEPANRAFSPSPDEIAEARAIVDAFALPENVGKGVIQIGGRMVERLHLAQAERLLSRA
ncbi:HpcH/HpaI aldolase/citrate lyase family protein [Aquibium microcysteis]|uniref:HpcH/HpaI aldolase/citrate lyase family protein n=1 Tax=Aquibium microcysteis TaxID=675281 RepID=UPI00165D011A|nr:CoA ester lyase [Aquibium microcysteis]